MAEIFALAEEEILIGFGMIGIKGKSVTGREDAIATFQGIVRDKTCMVDGRSIDLSDCKMLILSEDVSDMIGDELAKWQLNGAFPLIVEVPPLSGTSKQYTRLIDAVRQAIGIKIQ